MTKYTLVLARAVRIVHRMQRTTSWMCLTLALCVALASPTLGQTLPGTYALNPASASPAGWAQQWTAQLAGTSGWTGADGLYAIPMNGNRKLGSAYDASGWQMFSFNDSLIGTVNEFDQRTGFRFINNSIGMYSGTGATPTPISFKWKGDQNPPFDTAESMITGPIAGGLYWPLDGIVVPRVGGGQQFVQFAMKINGGLTPTGVSQMTWPLPDGVNYASNWPYNGNRGDTWNSSIDSVGPLPNLYKSDPDGSGPTGELVMGTAILDISNATTSYAANGYVHIYGTRNDFLSKKVFVARAVPENVSNPSAWAFWNASSSAWVSGVSAINSATPMRDTSNATIGDMAVEYSVTQLPDGRFVMVYLHADALGTQISARYATAPQGPWSARQMLYNVSIPNSGNPALGLPDISAYSDWKYVIYGAKAHAQLSDSPSGPGGSNAGKMLISFNVNNWKTNGSTSQPDPGWVYGSIYRPRFITVDIAGSLPGDFNDDGTVNAADYVLWRKQGGSPSQLATWRANFGQPAGSGASGYPLGASADPLSASVPEPAAFVLLSLALPLFAGRRCRRLREQKCVNRAVVPGSLHSIAAWLTALFVLGTSPQTARADIYQWEYINPANANLGRQASTMLVPGGAGANAVPGTNLSNRDLTKAYLAGAFLNNANLSIANLTNADFSTGSIPFFYVSQGLTTNLTGANLSQANLTNTNFSGVDVYGPEGEFYPYLGANLEGANLGGADTRGANFYLATWNDVNTNNMIWPGGQIAGLDLKNGASLIIRDYDGHPEVAPPAGVWPIVVEGQAALDATGKLRLAFDADSWGSTISFAPGISVALGGTLELDFAPGVNVASQIGRTIDLFDWTGVRATGAFTVSSLYTWNLSNLYTSGEVTLYGAPGIVPGDFNGDNKVDAADYVFWRKQGGTPAQYAIWRANFGQSGSGAGATAGSIGVATVPEPATIGFVVIAGIGFTLRGGRATRRLQSTACRT